MDAGFLGGFGQVVEAVQKRPPVTVAVAAANDMEALEALDSASRLGIARGILVGSRERILPMLEALCLEAEVVAEPDPAAAALEACRLVREGVAQVLMKGLVNSRDFMKAVLNAGVGLRTGRLLSHLAAFEVPGAEKLLFHTDGGINIAPVGREKVEILANALEALEAMGYKEPKVAVLAANEAVSDKMPATVQAAEVVEAWKSGRFATPCVVEGPIAMDVAVSTEAARHKGIQSRVSGKTDLFLMPNIEASNIASKSLIYYAGAKMAGIVLGASAPVVMTSRAETPEGKRNSIALACLVSGGKGEGK